MATEVDERHVERGVELFDVLHYNSQVKDLIASTVGASNFEPLFWLRAWNWCFRLVSMLLYEHIWFLNMLGLVDNDYRFVIKCNLRIYL